MTSDDSTSSEVDECPFCDLPEQRLGVLQIWQDEHWGLFVDLSSEVLGFSLLVPRRHLSHLGELRTGEAEALGPALARTTNALTAETGAGAAYVYVFDHPHLHIHLGPHTPDDALNSQIIRGEVITQELGGGLRRDVSVDFPLLPEPTLRAVADRVSVRLT